jgi:hypothetical protein
MVDNAALIEMSQKLISIRPPPKAPGGMTGKLPAKRKLPALTHEQKMAQLFPMQGGTANEPPVSY